MAVVAQMQPQAASMMEWFQGNVPELERPLVSVRSNLPEGILTRSYSFRSLKQEVLLGANSPVTIGLLAAMAIPAFQKVRLNAQEKTIQNNLRQFQAAAEQHMLETGKTSATYADVVGTEEGKYIRELKPVDGEDYESLVLNADDTELSVTTAKGKTVTLPVR
jgi:type IV pilus assembly protein PilA